MSDDTLDCSICLQTLIYPTKLPCGHIFCFLCIKGCAFHRKRCPMCRNRFSSRVFESPPLLNSDLKDKLQNILPVATSSNALIQSNNSNSFCLGSVSSHSPSSLNEYAWYYEGYEGWWQYDLRTCKDLEVAFNNKQSRYQVTIAGYIYIIDFKDMSQKRKDRSGRKRRIKRDFIKCEKKGIAGIKLSVITLNNNNDDDDDENKLKIQPKEDNMKQVIHRCNLTHSDSTENVSNITRNANNIRHFRRSRSLCTLNTNVPIFPTHSPELCRPIQSIL